MADEVITRATLREYLARYLPAKRHLVELQKRAKRIQKENEESSLKAITYSGMPKSNNISNPTAAPLMRYAEAVDRIEKQIYEVEVIRIDINAILTHLPNGTDNKNIIEMKYLDGKSDAYIQQKYFFASRSTVTYHINQGLDALLEIPAVIETLTEYLKDKEKWQ